MKNLICIFMAAVMVMLSFAGCSNKAVAYEDIDFSEISIDDLTETDKKTDYVIITIKNYGKIVIRLYPDVAPKTVKNFKNLVAEKFYDGTIFHRIIKNFMIQGGDPDGDGYGGSDKTIKGEFSANGFENNLKHTRGVVSMARASKDMNSASSQFFICHGNYSDGDGLYAAFGYVVYGMEVVDAIARTPTNSENRPKTQVLIESIKFGKLK